MRNQKQFERDTYLLDITKEASVFIMLVCGYFNQILISIPGVYLLTILSTIFMFIPRIVINKRLDKNVKGERAKIKQHNPFVKEMNDVLDCLKFVSLTILTLYVFLNSFMMENIGLWGLIVITSFMVVPRRLMNILVEDEI